jgi:hypothetical protein
VDTTDDRENIGVEGGEARLKDGRTDGGNTAAKNVS